MGIQKNNCKEIMMNILGASSFVTRFKFMKVLAVCLVLSALPVMAQNQTLYIESGVMSVNGAGGADLDVWGFTTEAGSNPMIPGPAIEATEGDTVTVRIVNNHDRSHNFSIPKMNISVNIPAGGSQNVTFTASDSGIFLYNDNNQVNKSMGLYGQVTIRPPTAGAAWTEGPAFDNERTWVVSDMDKANWNDVASSGGSVNTSAYNPNYFLLNGQGGFDAMHDPNTVADGAVGDTYLIRIANAGQLAQSLHYHGAHLQVISRNGQRLSTPEWQDTINVKPGETMMVLYKLRGGIFPMHIHTAQMETANGVYLNGTATLLVGN